MAQGSRALGLGGYRAHDHTAITLPPERPPTVKLDSVSQWIRESLFPLAVVTLLLELIFRRQPRFGGGDHVLEAGIVAERIEVWIDLGVV